MFLAKLVINERNRKVQKDLGNAHKFHQQIMQAFPNEANQHVKENWNPRQEWNILFRHEPDSNIVLVQSAIEPDWSQLPQEYLQKHVTKSINYTAEKFAPGQVFQFRLRANPSKRDQETRKTVGFLKQADQLTWLERQSDRFGFRIHSTTVIPSPNVFGQKGKGSSPIRVTTALFQGILKVTDSVSFTKAVCEGIGRGKSYGCGLLSVARYRA